MVEIDVPSAATLAVETDIVELAALVGKTVNVTLAVLPILEPPIVPETTTVSAVVLVIVAV